MGRYEPVTRRAAIVAGAIAATTLAGCLTDLAGDDGPSERSFEVTITRTGGSLGATVDPAGDAEGVIQVDVGDDVTFTYRNEASVPVGVHNHVTDAEQVVDAGASTSETFSPTDEQVGRHEIEGFVAEEGHDEDGHHDEETPTDHHEEGTETEHQEDGDHHDEAETTVLVAVEVRPG